MANSGRLHTFASNFNPTGGQAFFPNWVGNVMDTLPGYSQYGSAVRQRVELGTGQPLYINFVVRTSFSTIGRSLGFTVGSFDNAAFASARILAYGPQLVVNDGPLVKNDKFSVPLPSGGPLRRYLGIGFVASAIAANEPGRFDAWLDLNPVQSGQFVQEQVN